MRRDEGARVTLVSYGVLINHTLDAAQLLAAQGIRCEVVKLNEIKPLPVAAVRPVCGTYGPVRGDRGHRKRRLRGAAACAFLPGVRMLLCNAGDAFLRCGKISELQNLLGLDAAGIADRVAAEMKIEKTGEVV